MNKTIQALLLPIALILFVAMIFTLSIFEPTIFGGAPAADRQSLSDLTDDECPAGQVLVFDATRRPICIAATLPRTASQ